MTPALQIDSLPVEPLGKPSGLSLGRNRGGTNGQIQPQSSVRTHIMSLLLIAIAGWAPQPADSEREVCIQEVYQEGHWDGRIGETGLGRQNLNCNAMAKRTQLALWRTLELGTNLQSCPKLRQADGASIDTLPLTCLGWRLPWRRGWNFRLGGSFQLRMFPERDKVESCQHLELLVNESLRAGAGLSIDIAKPGSPHLLKHFGEHSPSEWRSLWPISNGIL